MAIFYLQVIKIRKRSWPGLSNFSVLLPAWLFKYSYIILFLKKIQLESKEKTFKNIDNYYSFSFVFFILSLFDCWFLFFLYPPSTLLFFPLIFLSDNSFLCSYSPFPLLIYFLSPFPFKVLLFLTLLFLFCISLFVLFDFFLYNLNFRSCRSDL